MTTVGKGFGAATVTISIGTVLMAYLDVQTVETADVDDAFDAIMTPTVTGETFSADEILALGQADAVEYTEKQFSGEGMADSEWAAL